MVSMIESNLVQSWEAQNHNNVSGEETTFVMLLSNAALLGSGGKRRQKGSLAM